MYAADRGIEELSARRGEELVTIDWLANRMQVFVDLHPRSEDVVNQFATWLARDDEE